MSQDQSSEADPAPLADPAAELSAAVHELQTWLTWAGQGGLQGFAAAAPAQPAPPAAAPAPAQPASAASLQPSTRSVAALPEPPPGRPAGAPRLTIPAPATPQEPAIPPPAKPARKVPLVTLDQVRADLGECTRCKLHKGRNKIVFGVGDPKARLVFVGEAPGEDEDLQGEPFVGKAGGLLTKMIEAMGLSREQVYICNTVKCRPPNNRNPEPDELGACEPFLKGQLSALQPEAIVTLGKFAAQALLRDQTPISRLRGAWREYESIPLMPTFHPAYLLRAPGEKGKVWADLQEVMKKLGLKPPRPGAGPA